MGIFSRFFKPKTNFLENTEEETAEELIVEIEIAKFQIMQAINLISSTISKIDFITFKNYKKVQEKEWYLWNYQPNKNTSGTVFLKEVISKLLDNNKCLIIQDANKQLFIADSFEKTQNVLKENIYSNVMVKDLIFKKTFKEKDVLYFEYNNKYLNSYLLSLIKGYNDTISKIQNGVVKSTGIKAIVTTEMTEQMKEDWKEALNQLYEKRFKNYLTKDTGIVVLPKGMTFDDKTKNYLSGGITDIVALTEEVTNKVAQAFNIPVELLKGKIKVEPELINQFITLAILPILDIIETEITRKRYTPEEVINGTYLTINKNNMHYIDILRHATNLEKLISSGLYSINDVLTMLNEENINEEWANKHVMTKNFAEITQITDIQT